MTFAGQFPKTLELLTKAQGEVFPVFAVGVRQGTREWLTESGCGPASLFDLASLTKVVCTTTLCALAVQKNLVSLDTPVKNFFPTFGDERVQLTHLLEHSSGLPWWLALHALYHEEKGLGTFNPLTTPREARTRYQAEIFKSHDPKEFEKRAVYSDLGFLLLGWALELAAGAPLDALFQEWIVTPLGLPSMQFLPVSPDVVPTENCPWRGRVLRGEVHDDNAFVLGGVAAHAGVFGDLRDILKFGRLWLDAALGSDASGTGFLKPEIARRFWRASKIPGSTRALGWDGISSQGSSTGKFFTPASRGHLGFTGTSLWIDPEKRLIVTLLTNRVHPSRANEKIKAFRPLFHDTLLSELGIG